MVHTIIVNNKSYDLPKKTVAITEKLDKALTADSIKGLTVRGKFEILHNFVKDLVGEENAAEILGSANLDDIDLSELALIVLNINEAYEKPLDDFQTERMRAKMSAFPMDKITSITNAAQVAASMQVMK